MNNEELINFLQAKETITINDENPLFLTSDLHFFHKRIVEFTGRPTLIDNHTEWLVRQINNKVSINASVFHLGDMFFSCTNEEAVNVLLRLNGNWSFVLGNHCNPSKLLTVVNTVNNMKGSTHKVVGWYYRLLVRIEPKIKNEKVYKKQLILSHFPIEDWEAMSHGSYMIHGHCHAKTVTHDDKPMSQPNNRLDVGLDNNPNWEPFSFEEAVRTIKTNNK